MSHAARRVPAFTLNTDGRPHPTENALTALTVVFGLIAFITAFFPGLHLLTSWTGLAGIITGAWGQYVSATTAERFLLVIFLGASAVGFYLGLSHGGLFGGLW
ncbi:hypothetical protein [Streptacidiphilus sp. ASG 303]|uniref:hypothetical protein n=1 Tax=Streptomycetaceae TaxID=2062 RepID=UPI001E56EF3B|nr:hypothetical protein [Streptacidiphilus sp. ASG 303]MCD0482183.1 hypothetical protein [Streptacidiphilus sp. ASG 303]